MVPKQRLLVGSLLVTVVLGGGLVSRVAAQGATVQAVPTQAWALTVGAMDQTSSPTIGDVNGDGKNDIVFGALDGTVRVLDANGHSLPGWPQNIGSAIDGAISIANLDNNNQHELVVPMGSLGVRNQQGGVMVLNSNGTRRCYAGTIDTFNPWTGGGPDGFRDPVYGAPAIGDVNGDGRPDIVFGSFDHRVHAVDGHCHELPGFPYDALDTVWPSPALYDIDNDGRAEIFIGIDSTATPTHPHQGGALVALKWVGNGVQELWRRETNDVIHSSPAIADIDGDGRLDVVTGVGDNFNASDANRVFAFHADNGSDVAGYPITRGGQTLPSVALGDLNGDGHPDVVVGSWDGVVAAYSGSHLLWQRFLGVRGSVGSPIIADMNGDGHNDVGIGNIGGFWVLDGRNGGVITEVNKGESFWTAGAVGNFGSSGWRLVSVGFRPGSFRDSRIESDTIPAPRATPPWPMFHLNAGHVGAPKPTDRCRPAAVPAAHPTAGSANGYWVLSGGGGVYNRGPAVFYGSPAGRMGGRLATAINASPTGHGYYTLDTGGVIRSYGNAPTYGSMAGKHLNGAIVGLAPTPSGHGYWLLGSDGGIFTFGDARFYGSMGAKRLNAPIIAMASTKTGRGYWLLGADGGIFTFGDARFYGSTGAMHLNAPMISMATAPSGKGYWLVARDGGVFSFGAVSFYGSAPGLGLCTTPAGRQIRPTLSGHGYYVLATDGRVLPFGDAKGFGSAPFLSGFNTGVDMTIRPFK